MAIKSFRWTGAKTCAGRAKQGAWILSLLPQPASPHFAEICGGSAAIMLNKPRVSDEMYNDIDGRLVNFWEVLQSADGDRLCHRIETTLMAEAVFLSALGSLDSGDPFEMAWAFAVVSSQRFPSMSDISKSSFMAGYGNWALRGTDWREMAERCLGWGIYNRRAEDMLALWENKPDIDIYFDPPYPKSSSSQTAYAGGIDVAEMTEIVQACKGNVAISGMDDEWDHLGWDKHTLPMIGAMSGISGTWQRDEVLWTNYPAQRQERLL